MLPVIDAHHHIWDLDANRYPWLQDEPPIPFRYGDYRAMRRNYMPSEFRRDSARQNVVSSVYMEAEHDPADPLKESRWIHEIAAREGLPNAVAGAAFFDRADAAQIIRAQAAMPLVRSLRHKPKGVACAAEYDPGHRTPGSMRCATWRAGYRYLADSGLHFELQTPWWHLGDALDLARDFPGTLIVLNHLGLPADRGPEALRGWRDAMARFAEAPNVRVKLSGCCVPGQRWTPDMQAPVVLDAIRLFGPERCMVASNFPVDGLLATYDEIIGGMRTIIADLSDAAQRRILSGTAAETYGLPTP